MRLFRLLAYLWALPTTMVGMLFLPLALISGGGAQVVSGVLEIYGGVVALLLRRCVPIKGGASAMTLGHVVIGQDRQCLARTRRHERIHVKQCEQWGPLFIPGYLLASAWTRCRGRDAYAENWFERQAYQRDSELAG